MTGSRLPTGGRVDRLHSVDFYWNNKKLEGFAGDTLASALIANGESIVGRSFKYHRPRGVMSCGVEESGAIVTIGDNDRRDPNVKATTQELYANLKASGQNGFPSVNFDLGSVNNLMSRFLSAGFYYKTFMGLPPFEHGRGTGMWMRYEKLIRKAAGMGTASREPDPDHYEHGHLHCDVLVVGSGPAGLAAASTAVDAGLDVVLVEQDFELGGSYLSSPVAAQDCTEAVAKLAGARVMRRTTAFGLYDNAVVGLLERVTDHLPVESQDTKIPRQRFITARAKHIVLATGALERSYAFGNNDLPGTMAASAAETYINRYAVLPGSDVVVSTNNDSAYSAALTLASAGAKVTLLDARQQPTSLAQALIDAEVEVVSGAAVSQANGLKSIKSVSLATIDSSGPNWTASGRSISCDLLLTSGGWSPVINLLSHRGVRPVWDDKQLCFVAPEHAEPIHMAGSAAGLWMTEDCLSSGIAAAQRAIHSIKGTSTTTIKGRDHSGGWDNPITPLYHVAVGGRKSHKCFIDPQHDVTVDDMLLAHREGFVSVEHAKRYTTLGMATDQGKMGNVLGIALMAQAQGKSIPEVGTTTFRPPYTPVSIGALAGRGVANHFKPLRRTPLHDWNINHGATMIEAGLWQRTWYFARDSETIHEAYKRETETTRKSLGIVDVSTLGKIAVQGPDAPEFIERIYSNNFKKLAVGKARYGIMLRDDGFVMDDGTTWKLSDTEYFMTTTTAQAATVMVWLEELLQVRWPELRVHVTSVSDQWAGVSVAGPKAREVLGSCVTDAALITHDALPFMGVLQTTLNIGVRAPVKTAIPCRIARISFSGELAYEVYVGADHGNLLMDSLRVESEKFGGCMYGMEALGALRIEKGHVTGAELDGRVTIEDAGLGAMASKTKSFIGSALRLRPELQREDRPKLVGIVPKDTVQTFNAGSILCAAERFNTHQQGHGEGWITAVTYSPELGHWIGLGFISGGLDVWHDKTVIAADPVRAGNVEVRIISPHMVDPDGERMRV